MTQAFTIKDLRCELGLGTADFAQLLGIKSKSTVSEIERGAPVSTRIALRIEDLSGGRIDAATLNEDIALARLGHVRAAA